MRFLDESETQKKSEGISSFFNDFLDKFFETIEDENTELNLYDKFMHEIEKTINIKNIEIFQRQPN